MIKNQLKTQTFNDGVVKIYSVTNTAPPGDQPNEALSIKRVMRYKERTVGVQRYWSAKQAMARVDALLRVQRLRDVSSQDIAIPNDGLQYRIEQIQYPEDIYPHVMDLSLVRLEEDYAIAD